MNKHFKRLICALSAIMVIMLIGVFAFADAANITVAPVKNGEVTVTEENGRAVITTVPADGYIAVSVRLGYKTIYASEPNVYKCDIPCDDTQLNVMFRRVRLTISEDEMAMTAGETRKVSSYLSYTDGDIETRLPVMNRDFVYTSSDPSVVSVDNNGMLTAHKMGYARINAYAAANDTVGSFFYVIVDGDKSPVVGTIQLDAYFRESEIVNYGISNLHPGHSFLIFRNTSGHDIRINTKNMYICRVPTDKYYDTLNSYDGTGIDPMTFYYVTDGKPESSDNKEARYAYADSGFFETYARGELATYTVENNDLVTIGNTGEDGVDEMIKGDVSETLLRFGLEKFFSSSSSILQSIKETRFFFVRMIRLVNELCVDFTLGYNPVNGYTDNGGVCVNNERYSQMKSRDFTDAAACRTAITRLQLEAMIDFAQYENYFNFLGRNCTMFASDAWNLVTAAKPQYHMEPDIGGVTNALAAPLFLRNRILTVAPLFAFDDDIEFFNGIDVIKPEKTA